MTKIYRVEGPEEMGRVFMRQASGRPSAAAAQKMKAGRMARKRPQPQAAERGFSLLGYAIDEISEGQMDLLIMRDRMKKNRDIVSRKRGIGALRTQKFQNTIDMVDDALYGIETFESISDQLHWMGLIDEALTRGEYANEHAVHGIGCADEIAAIRHRATQGRRERMHRQMQKNIVAGLGDAYGIGKKSKTKTGGFLKKAVQKTKAAVKNVAKKTTTVAKKVGKGAVKVAKKAGQVAVKVAKTVVKYSPTALIAKGILEVALPKAAPFFLYLFINDPAIIAKLPAKVKRKRDKAQKIKNFIVNVLGMKDSHFMGLVRNGIVKQMGASPETVLAGMLKGIKGIRGIGIAPLVTLAVKAVPVLIELLNKLMSVFKKKGETATADDAPAADDFSEVSDAIVTELSTAIKKQNDIPEPDEERLEKTLPSTQQQQPDVSRGSASTESVDTSGGGGSTSVDAGSGSGGGSTDAPATTTEDNTVDANNEVKTEAFATGGRKGWNSFG